MAKQAVKAPKKKKANKKRHAPAVTAEKPAVEKTVERPEVRPPRRLPSVWQLTKLTVEILRSNWRVLLTVTLIYGLLNLLLVRGLSSGTNLTDLKQQLSGAFSGHFGSLASGLSIFVVLLGGSGNGSSQTAGSYQFFLTLIASLAVIWSLRQLLAGRTIRARDAYYRGMYPLIPLILVLFVIGLQLIPLVVGSTVYSLVISNGIAVHLIEKILWFALFIALAFLSLYWLSSSLIALYIVTLPDMTPLQSLRSARDLVKGRRLQVIRKVLYLPAALLVTAAVVMLPIILLLTPLAQWIFFLLSTAALAIIHTYMYTLYRELLNE